MNSLAQRVLLLVQEQPGLSDREITDLLVGVGAPQQAVNQACRALQARGRIERRLREDGKFGNSLTGRGAVDAVPVRGPKTVADGMSEDDVKRALEVWLKSNGWERVDIAWGKSRGTDIVARRGGREWIIEAKGCGSLNPMRVNYFLAILGELLQRMEAPDAKYSIALPDLPQFRRLWSRLPALAKSRTTISALFVNAEGSVAEEQ
jgi:hypothetical protein